jgi:hypothetical protein
MSTFWSVFYGVFLAGTTIYLIDIFIEAIKERKRKRELDLLWESLEDEEDED